MPASRQEKPGQTPTTLSRTNPNKAEFRPGRVPGSLSEIVDSGIGRQPDGAALLPEGETIDEVRSGVHRRLWHPHEAAAAVYPLRGPGPLDERAEDLPHVHSLGPVDQLRRNKTSLLYMYFYITLHCSRLLPFHATLKTPGSYYAKYPPAEDISKRISQCKAVHCEATSVFQKKMMLGRAGFRPYKPPGF